MKVNKLSDFGYAFQIKLIALLFKDRLFLQQIVDILDSSYFESEANIVILDIIKDYFKEYNTLPTLEAMKIKIIETNNLIIMNNIHFNKIEIFVIIYISVRINRNYRAYYD